MKTFLNFALLLLISTILQIVQAIKIDNLSFRDKQDYRGLNGKQQFSFSQADPSCATWSADPQLIVAITAAKDTSGDNLITSFRAQMKALLTHMTSATSDSEKLGFNSFINIIQGGSATSDTDLGYTLSLDKTTVLSAGKELLENSPAIASKPDINKLVTETFDIIEMTSNAKVIFVLILGSDSTDQDESVAILKTLESKNTELKKLSSSMKVFVHKITDNSYSLSSNTVETVKALTGCSDLQQCAAYSEGIVNDFASNGAFASVKNEICTSTPSKKPAEPSKPPSKKPAEPVKTPIKTPVEPVMTPKKKMVTEKTEMNDTSFVSMISTNVRVGIFTSLIIVILSISSLI